MMIKHFQEARAAVTEMAALEQANMLAGDALFPVNGCFYIYPDGDKQHPKEPIVSSDQAGVLLTINDLFIREPERFGDAANRTLLQQRCHDLFKAFEFKKMKSWIASLLIALQSYENRKST